MLPQLGTWHLTLRVYLRLANRPSAQFANSSKQEQPSIFKNNPQASGTGTAFLQVKQGYWLYESLLGVLRARSTINFFPTIHSTQETTKNNLPTSYVQGQIFNVSSTKHRVLPSKNLSSQRNHYYKVYIR